MDLTTDGIFSLSPCCFNEFNFQQIFSLIWLDKHICTGSSTGSHCKGIAFQPPPPLTVKKVMVAHWYVICLWSRVRSINLDAATQINPPASKVSREVENLTERKISTPTHFNNTSVFMLRAGPLSGLVKYTSRLEGNNWVSNHTNLNRVSNQ